MIDHLEDSGAPRTAEGVLLELGRALPSRPAAEAPSKRLARMRAGERCVPSGTAMKRATGSGFLLAASLALVLRGTDADALSPSPDVLCCLSQRSACRAEPPSPEECRKILESFARVQEQWERQLPGESRLARAANALWQHSFAVLALAAGIALWVLSRKAGRGSLVARALFVAGGVSLGLGFLFLMASLQIGAR